MNQIIIPRSEFFQKGFVKAHTRKGKQVASYFTKTKKNVAIVRHKTKTRMDLSGDQAKAKIKALESKKQRHSEHIDHATILKAEVEKHKAQGNTHFKVGKTEHHVDKVLKDLKDHIDHHSNEKKSHDNHINKIKDRHETEAKHWEKKAVVIESKKKLPKKAVTISGKKIKGNSGKTKTYEISTREKVSQTTGNLDYTLEKLKGNEIIDIKDVKEYGETLKLVKYWKTRSAIVESKTKEDAISKIESNRFGLGASTIEIVSVKEIDSKRSKQSKQPIIEAEEILYEMDAKGVDRYLGYTRKELMDSLGL
jgi:hypothetical protein